MKRDNKILWRKKNISAKYSLRKYTNKNVILKHIMLARGGSTHSKFAQQLRTWFIQCNGIMFVSLHFDYHGLLLHVLLLFSFCLFVFFLFQVIGYGGDTVQIRKSPTYHR